MALIKCPECDKEISDKAQACPHCGCPIVNQHTEMDQQYTQTTSSNISSYGTKPKHRSELGIATLILGIIGLLFSAVFIGIFPCVLALIFACIVIFRKKDRLGFAIGGAICGILGIAIFVFIYRGLLFPDPPIEPIKVEFGETYTINDILEFTPTEGRLAPVVLPSTPSGSTLYWIMGDDNELPYELKARITNLGTEEISVTYLIDAEFLINDTYTVDAEIEMENSDGTKFEYDRLQPLQTRTFHIYAMVPQEIWEICEKCTLTLAFPDNYEDRADIENDPIYTIEFDEEKISNDLTQ